RAGVDRLLVAVAGCRLAPTAPEMPGQPEAAFSEARFVSEPAKRLEADRHAVLSAGRRPAEDQRVRQGCVVVAQPLLEPAPVRRGSARMGRGDLVDEAIQELRRPRIEAVGIESREAKRGI